MEAYVIDNSPQEDHAPVHEGTNFADRFEKDGISICVNVRVKPEEPMLRVWLGYKPKPFCRINCYDLVVEITRNENETGKPEAITIDMAVENIDGINKGRVGMGVFQSLTSSDAPYLTPPFWWLTGLPRVDASTERFQRLENGRDSNLGETSDLLYRHSPDDHLLRAIREVRWRIMPDSLIVDARDSGLELIDAFFGPLNGR